MSVEQDLTGKTVSGCHLTQLIARGPLGPVYMGQHTPSKREVIVRFVEGTTKDVDETLRDLRLIAKVNHPSVLRIFQTGKVMNSVFLVTEHLEGETVYERLERDGRIKGDQAVYIAAQVAHALEALHKLKVFHRDLKPSNIFLPSKGRPKIIDTALLRTLSPSCAAPELWKGKQANCASDLYALGLTLYNMVLGRPAFTGDENALREAHLKHPVPSPKAIPSDLTNDVVSVIIKLTHKKSGLRYESAESLAGDLEAISLGEKPKALIDLEGSLPCPVCETENARSHTKCAGCGEPIDRARAMTIDELLPEAPPPPGPVLPKFNARRRRPGRRR